MAIVDETLRQVPPQNLEAETAILGGILADPAALGGIAGSIVPDDFYLDSHRKIFSAMLELFYEGQPIDLVTLSDLLKVKGCLDGVGGSAYIAMLTEGTPTAANIKYYRDIIKRCALSRVGGDITRDALTRFFEDSEDPAILAGEIASRLLGIQSLRSKGFVHVGELTASAMKRIEMAEETKSAIGSVPTGLAEFERRCGSVRRGQLVVVGGRTSTGKTSFALTVGRHIAANGHGVAFVSAESPLDEITLRLLSQMTQIENIKLQNGLLRDAEISRLSMGAERLSNLPLWVLDKIQNWELIKSFVRGHRARHPDLAAVIIDYAQLLDARTNERRRDLEVSKISKESKAMALELDIAVFLLSQLNRDLEKQNERKPVLSDLKESGSLEQDADIVFLLSHDKSEPGRVDLDVAKMRDGRAKVIIPLRFDGATVSFGDWIPGVSERRIAEVA